jgi:acyl-[acyl-carrier-protein]-phospholipid O-acyltransferase / long-chain-fatty-acid--[acyl-carrier-protein] ligase
MTFFFKGKISSFTYLNVTQFLGALNDNIYKLLIVYFFIQLDGIQNSHIILSITGAIFVLPFLLFSISSGTLADRFSKRNIIVCTKFLELLIMLLGVVAFSYESKILSYTVLFLMASQSALFGPSKYGIIPELVPQDNISKANGLMTSFTFLAIILGTFLASFLLQITGRHFIVATLFCSAIALIGFLTSFGIEYTPPAGSQKKLNPDIFQEIYSTLQLAKKETSLLAAVFGSAFFMFLGAFVQLNMIPFAVQSLDLTDVQGGYLFLLTALGIGTGAILAGKISGKTVELGLVPITGLGLTISLYMLDLYSNNLYASIFLVTLLGMFGGIFEIPLDSYIQVASPKKSLGQVVAATNFLSFFGVLCASGLLYLITEIFGISADRGFTVIGTLALVVTIIFGFQFFDYLTRLVATILSRIHFKITVSGIENIPRTPAIYVCTHTAWNDTLLILGAQRRRIRFFIENEQAHSKFLLQLYKLLRIISVPSIEPLENNEFCMNAIKSSLKKGISVCIFINHLEIHQEIEKLKNSQSFKEIFDEINCPIIPVIIEKGEKNSRSRFFTRLLNKIRVPASISFNSTIFSRPFSSEALLKCEAEEEGECPDWC